MTVPRTKESGKRVMQRFNREALRRGRLAYAAARGRSIASRVTLLGGTLEPDTEGSVISRLSYEAPPAIRLRQNHARIEDSSVKGTALKLERPE